MLKILKPGFYTSVQDSGRFGYRHFGVPVSGALDMEAFNRANALLENPENAAVLEITMQGPTLEFELPTFMVLTGAPMEAALDGKEVQMDYVYQVQPGSRLVCGHIEGGFRTYLALRGGIRTPEILGSRSQYYPVTAQPALKQGIEVAYDACTDFEPKLLKWSAPDHFKDKVLGVYPAPEYEFLSPRQQEQLFEGEFQLAKEHDRMACQLSPTIAPHSIQIITSATLPGTVQLTPSGRLMILMRDGQTTGGYPRILQLDENAQNLLSQKKFGDSIRFKRL